MPNLWKKTVAALLLFALAASTFASCAGDQTPTSTPTETTGSDIAITTAADTTPEKILYDAGIPAGTDYGGEDFNLHIFDSSVHITWVDVDFSATEETGDTLNDAVYIRMRNVNEKLNININPIPSKPEGADMKKSVQSGDDAYDAGFVMTHDASSLAQSGLLVDLHTIDELQLDQPWWDQNAVEDLSVLNKLFMVTGDIGTMYKKSIGVILFNKQLVANDPTLPNPYELVDNMTWTIEAFTEMGKKVSEDVNGDSKWDKEDKYGLLFYCDLVPLGFIGSGIQLATKNEEDIPEITFYSDKTVKVYEKYAELLFDETLSFSWTEHNVGGNDGVIAMFQDNRGLFNYNEFHAIENMRQMDTDFGILPIPLYEEGQDSYHHVINPHVAAMLVVPKSGLDMTRIAHVLDALGAESKNILTPAYYETYLKGKGTRDNESEAVLDIVFSTLRYDAGYMNDWGTIGTFILPLVNNHNLNLTSQYEKIENKVIKALEKAISNYEKNT
ncbi:MAG: extracellular solute-binding protein [Clostridia bacterium]|nr:extracellular solute-binding protein [Clostridia bacterium]